MSAEWFYTTNKQQMGPVSWTELRDLASAGILKPHDLVWCDGMDEWVKAIRQKGLFAEEEAEEAVSAKKSSYAQPKPPPGRRRRQTEEDDEDEEEEEEKNDKRKARKKQQQRTQMAVGVKVGLILGGALLLLLLLSCGVGTIIYFSLRGGPRGGVGAPPFAGGGAPRPNPIPIVNPQMQVVVFGNLPPKGMEERNFNFQAGKTVTITATSHVMNPQTDVDLWVFRGNLGQNLVAQDMSIGPNSRVEFVVPANDVYRIRIGNHGPGIANMTNVTINQR